ncbi:MAG TPA: crossover junction endodeoxyribonuclease RuvC [Fimbriimonadaceae bacterium]|mgnify:CR=1 FL=1|nr:crossover junction endodeoxyribonuclease RuvC [Fimbriimonadaceae bacterium]
MRVLGIDPGLERIGFGVIDRVGSKLHVVTYGLIETPRIGFADRLLILHQELRQLIEMHKPDTMATEKLLFSVNRKTAMDVAKALGVIILTSSETGLPWTEYSPPEVKLAVVGNGSAEKKQVQFMVTKLLGLLETPKPDDVADALAIAICHAMKSRLEVRL